MTKKEKIDFSDIPELTVKELKQMRRVTPAEHKKFSAALDAQFGKDRPRHQDLLTREIIHSTKRAIDLGFFPRPIQNKTMHKHFFRIISSLAKGLGMEEFKGIEKTAVEVYVGAVGHFIAEYEKVRYPNPDVPPHELLEFLMQQSEITQEKMAHILKTSQSVVSKILRGKRKLTVDHIARLSKQFKVSPATFFSK